jgi:hypothetical protein
MKTAHFYHSVQLFQFARASEVRSGIARKLSGDINDDLLGSVPSSFVLEDILYEIEDDLVGRCAKPVTLGLTDEIVAKFKAVRAGRKQRQAMKVFVTEIPKGFHRYKLAKTLDFIDPVEQMKIENPVVCEWCDELYPDEEF